MKAFKKISGSGIALLMAVSMGTVYAEVADVTQTQERTRLKFDLQAPGSDFGQSQNSEQHTVMNTNQNQHQYKYQYQNKNMNKDQNGGADSGSSLTKNRNTEKNTWQGGNAASGMNRMSATNRNMQGSSVAGSMNRQSTASRSMGGRR
ncbi:MAG: hypothetical protein GQ549_00475 [Gammaproteobacteria bacterium]|nr:hypothetical protein [Gammaproteobacteria bacterium]